MSRQLFLENKDYLSGGVASTLHKSALEEYPIFIDRGKGSRLYDVDGNEYIDYVGAFGPVILGYCPSAVNGAVKAQIDRGTQFALPTASLRQLSELLVDSIPCADRVSFQSTGTEAVMQAVQIARAYTGKTKIVKFEGHYHGWCDEMRVSLYADSEAAMGPRNRPWRLLSSPGQRRSASDDVIVLPWNDEELLAQTLRRQGDTIAAVICEPIMCNAEVVFPKPGYLEAVRRLTREHDVLFILDEVITGFRVAYGGAQELYHITPDLATFGKALAGGYPIACVAGRREVMEAGTNAAGTFNANPLCVAASLATLGILSQRDVYARIAGITRLLTDGVAALGKQYGVKLHAAGVTAIWMLQFGVDPSCPLRDYRDHFKKVDKPAYASFYREALRRGVRLHPSRGRFYVSAAHTEEDVNATLLVFEDILKGMEKSV